MRKRYQQGSVTKSSDGRYWIGKYREDGRHKTKSLGKIREITKSKAKEKFTEFLKPLVEVSPNVTFKSFVDGVYLPFYERKWKQSTAMTNKDRIQRELVTCFAEREMRKFTRDDLQAFLDSKSSLSFSTVDHLRWDLRQIFEMAVADGIIHRNPASQLFTPRECSKPQHRVMTVADIKQALGVLGLRERLIFKLAVFAGLRPGEIFGIRRTRLSEDAVDIQERIYRGKLDTPKTQKSIRLVPLSASVREDLENWLAVSPVCAEAWLFPSENLETAFSKDNALYRFIRPLLTKVKLGWVNFQVMRRTHSSLMRELGVDPKIVADLMGHDVNTNLNVYTQTTMESRLQAVETLETAFVN
jgi:integrase